MQILIKKATVICSDSKYHLKKKDILVKNGIIEKIADNINEKSKIVIDQKNNAVSPGWVDLFSDFGDPGHEQRDTLLSGMNTAAAGGYSDVFVLPNNNPVTSGKATVEYIRQQNQLVNLYAIGAISKKTEGKDLAEMYDMFKAGAIAFSDGRKPVQNSGLLMKSLQYIKTFEGIIIEIPEERELSKNGLMNEGNISTQIGIQGIPAIAENIQTYRNIELLRYTGSKLHLTGISTAKSLDLIRQAKKQKLNITCSVSPYHLLYNDTQLHSYNSIFKVNPPLRSEADRLALLRGIHDGTIDCIASHHSPQNQDDKQVEFEYAQNGMLTLQTMLPMLLQSDPSVSIEKWIGLLSENPRRIFSLKKYSIAPGEPACLNIFNTQASWRFDEQINESRSLNSPLLGQTLKGKIVAVINNNHYRLYE